MHGTYPTIYASSEATLYHKTHPLDEAKKLTTLVPDFLREAACSILAYKPRCRAVHGRPAVKMFSFTVAFVAAFLASGAAAHGGVSSYIIGGELNVEYEWNDWLRSSSQARSTQDGSRTTARRASPLLRDLTVSRSNAEVLAID